MHREQITASRFLVRPSDRMRIRSGRAGPAYRDFGIPLPAEALDVDATLFGHLPEGAVVLPLAVQRDQASS